MSHFTQVKTNISDEPALITALKAMGLNAQVSTKLIRLRNSWSSTDYAHIVVPHEQLGGSADVGFRRSDEGLICSADDYELKQSRYPEFRYNVAVEYQAALAQQKGYQVVGRRTTADGRIQLQLQTQEVRQRR